MARGFPAALAAAAAASWACGASIPPTSPAACAAAAQISGDGWLEAAVTTCGLRRGFVPFRGNLLHQALQTVNSTEACAALCAGTALQGCGAFSFCSYADSDVDGGYVHMCTLLSSVVEGATDWSPIPGKCDSGRPCAAPCKDLDEQVALVFPGAALAAVTRSCQAAVAANAGNCWSSQHDGGGNATTGLDLRFVQSLCPVSCRSCALVGTTATSNNNNNNNNNNSNNNLKITTSIANRSLATAAAAALKSTAVLAACS
ncbi:unnamed protein product, partial [Polarella glacialis]